jgi:predicted nucleic acid-binding protein
LLQGCQNSREQKRIEKAFDIYPLFWAEPECCDRALKNFAAHHLSHHIGLIDTLIAETAISVEAELATFNAKYYTAIKQLMTFQP